MTSTVFVDQSAATPIVAAWLNDVNTATYDTVPAQQTEISQAFAALGFSTPGAYTPAQTALNLGILPVLTSVASIRNLLKTGAGQAFSTGYYTSGDGGGGNYRYNAADTTSGALFTGSIAGTVLTVGVVANGALAVGQAVNVPGIANGTYISSLGTGTGGVGTYNLNITQSTIASTTMTADNGGSILVAYDGGRWYLVNTGSLSIQQFGAQVGGLDCYYPIQAAINTGISRLHAPAGLYTIKKTLNFTNRSSVPMAFYGDGAYVGQTTGTTFKFLTGTWMADMTGCQFLHLEHMHWLSDGTTGFSTLGVLYARSTTVNFAIFNSMFKMVIELPSSTGSGAGSIAVADNCMENCIFDQCWFVADCPYATTLGNELALSSTYTTIANTNFSNTDKTFRQCVFVARNQYAMYMIGAADSTWDQCNWTLNGGLGAGVGAALFVGSSVDGYQKCANLRFTGDFESFPAIAALTANTQGLVFDCTSAGLTGSAYILNSAGTTQDGLKVKVNTLSGAQLGMVLTSSGVSTVHNAEIHMNVGQTILDGNLTITSGMIYGGGNDLSNTSILSVNPVSGFSASYINSKLTGQVAWAPGSVPGSSTVVTTLSVPGAVGGSSVKVKPPYAIPFCIASGYVASSNLVELMLSNVNGSASAAFANGTWIVEVDKIYAQ